MTTTTTTTTRRPVLITALVVLVVLSGIGAALTAWITFATAGTEIWGGIVSILVALAYFAVAKGLFNGNPTARSVAAAVAVVQIVMGLLLTFADDTATAGPDTLRIGSLIFPVLALVILFTPKANAFFGSRR